MFDCKMVEWNRYPIRTPDGRHLVSASSSDGVNPFMTRWVVSYFDVWFFGGVGVLMTNVRKNAFFRHFENWFYNILPSDSKRRSFMRSLYLELHAMSFSLLETFLAHACSICTWKDLAASSSPLERAFCIALRDSPSSVMASAISVKMGLDSLN